MSFLEPTTDEQRLVLDKAVDVAVARANSAGTEPVSPTVDAAHLRQLLEALDPEVPLDATAAIDWVAEYLETSMVHTTSPRYFGLFNPSPSFMGIVGDLMAAVYNPQLAVWSHAPGPVELEAWLVRFLADRIGFPAGVGGSFTSGGAEANAAAVHLALTRTFPDFGDRGLRAVDADPVVYISVESHHAWVKIAHATGIGRDAIRHIPVTDDLKLDTIALRVALEDDTAAGKRPTLVVATAGTTSAGVIDDLHEIHRIAQEHGAFFHVDAAWGGSAVLSDTLRPHLDGIELADSVTIDAHKWMSVPMGAGIFITPHAGLLNETYRISTAYMPDAVSDTVDPYATTNQWSRRFMGLKLFLSLITAGRTGYQAQLDHDTELGTYLHRRLTSDGWEVINETPLPVVCFIDPSHPDDMAYHQQIVDEVLTTGRAWISTTAVNGRPTIRVCITSHRTTRTDIDELVGLLATTRA
ncbi:MAG: pyridoxal phosphate-dependent decarboxylase family protein [Acidimicrobiia bacterium]